MTQDTDGSGAIDAEELAVVFEKLGEPVSEKRVMEMIDEVDEDNTGEIEFVEFLDLMSRFKKGESKFASLGKLSSVRCCSLSFSLSLFPPPPPPLPHTHTSSSFSLLISLTSTMP